jgi:hypothetical protein
VTAKSLSPISTWISGIISRCTGKLCWPADSFMAGIGGQIHKTICWEEWIIGCSTARTARAEMTRLYHEVGVDNSNILFVEYVTSLRGFDYNTFNGENAMLFNAELRIPLVRYLKRGPISSNFLRNLQFIGFYDIGSAWTGSSPFATENSVNTEILEFDGNPFRARIQNYKNPWLSSYGFGVRTVLLGYYVKLDVAYPIEDFVVKDPRFFVTLGYDF